MTTQRFRLSDGKDILVRVDDSETVRGDGTNEPKKCNHDKYEWVHEYDEDSMLGDWYWCSGCKELTQVG